MISHAEQKRLTSDKLICINGRLFMMSLPTPITTKSPPLRTVNEAVITLDSTPVHSKMVSGASYSVLPNNARIAFAFSSGFSVGSTWYVWQEGTKSFAKARRFGSKSVITSGWAPDARAAARAMSPIGPAPQITAPRPSDRRVRERLCITTDRGSRRAPCAYDTFSGSLGDISTASVEGSWEMYTYEAI